MRYRIDPQKSVADELRRIAVETLDEAVQLLEGLAGADVDDSIERVHRTRKRCKETRGLVRLARVAIGDAEYATIDGLVRDAARELSELRDVQVTMTTVEHLLDHADDDERSVLHELYRDVTAAGVEASRIDADDRRVRRARKLLRRARTRARRWEPADDVAALAEGLARTHRQGAKSLGRLIDEGDDEHSHEWRKRVKHLWYQTRLLQATAPPLLGPLVAMADECAEALGDDHDLAVLVELLESKKGPRRHLGDASSDRAAAAARRRQQELRERALRLGRYVYAEDAASLATRVAAYWEIAADGPVADPIRPGLDGPDADGDGVSSGPRSGGELASASTGPIERAAPAPSATSTTTGPSTATIERERKFLVSPDTVVDDLDDGVLLEQGYLALDGTVAVRVRRIGGVDGVLTLKAGVGTTRTEVEWAVDDAQFDALWPLTTGRRVIKTRHDLVVGTWAATLDVFHEGLDGLRVIEVEFDDDPTMLAFRPPPWFGRDVTDDARYTNAALSSAGRPPGD